MKRFLKVLRFKSLLKIMIAFVIKRGKVSKPIKNLIRNTREVFYPYTAINLKESEKEKIKNIMRISANFNVSSILMFSSTEKSNLLKVAKTPHGPTFTFKIVKYSNNQELQELLPRGKKISAKNLSSSILRPFPVRSSAGMPLIWMV